MAKPNRAERRMPVKTAIIRHSGDYDGWEATVRINPPLRVWEDIQSGDYERQKQGIAAVVTAWNYVDEDGKDLPLPKDGGLSECPPDLLTVLVEGFNEEITKASAIPKA